MKILVFNCGSSSVKYQLFEMPQDVLLAKGVVERIGEEKGEAHQKAERGELRLEEHVADHAQGLELVRRMLTDPERGAIASLDEVGACGHRVVHGGEDMSGSIVIDAEVESKIEGLFELAPLHNPPNLTGIREARRMLGSVPQVACFDTAFHQTIPPHAFLYALPYEMYEDLRVRRYGFHGTSHRYVARRAAAMLGKGKYDAHLITCHLGNGCSVAAVKAGRSVDTSMGLTPLEGLVMGTRTGDLDPAITFYLERMGYTTDQLDQIFNKKSGLLGLSKASNDVRDLEERAAGGDAQSALALDVFAYRVRKYIGAYLAVLNGCDGIVMTGGIGENGVNMRRRILGGLDGLGVRLDEQKNEAVVGSEGRIDVEGSPVGLLVVPTNEEAAIAFDTCRIVKG